MHQDTVSEILRKMADLPEPDKPIADDLVDFDRPCCTVWKCSLISKSRDFSDVRSRVGFYLRGKINHRCTRATSSVRTCFETSLA